MYLVLFAAVTAVYAEPYGYKAYLPPTPGPLFRNSAFGGSVQGVPAGGYTNDLQGVVVDADPPGSSRSAPGIESGLGRPRESYGSTNSKVGEAGFKTTFGAFSDRNIGPGTRIAPGFESIVSGSEGGNDFKIGDAAYKIAPGFLTNEFLKTSAEEIGTRRKEQDVVNCAHGSYDAQKYNKGNSENLPHNDNQHFGSIHGSIGTINHSTQFNNKFGKPVSNQVNENHQIVNNAGTDQINHVYSPIGISEINKESSLTSHGEIPGSTPSVTSVIKPTSQSSGHISQTGSTYTKDLSDSIANQVVKPSSPSNFGGGITSSVVSEQTGISSTQTGEANNDNNLSVNKESLGYQYKVPPVIFDSQKFNGYSHFRETNIQGIQNEQITSKPVGKGEATFNQGLINVQEVQGHSVQSTTQSIPNTNINMNNVVAQTTSQLQTDKAGQTIKSSDISSTGLATPFTSYANIQSSEGVLGINSKYSTTKSRPETATGTLSIVPTKPLSTFTNYHSSSQTQLPSFNFDRPNKYSHTFGINKPISTLPPHLSASKTSFAGIASTSYNPNKFTSHIDNTRLNGQAISSAKPVENALTVLNTNKNNSGEFSSLKASSEVSAPALSLNYLIQEGNQENEESSAVDINSNIQTAIASVSTGFTEPQNIDGKQTLSSAKRTQIQGSDHSYYYDKPQQPLVIPTKSNYGSLDIAQTGTRISTSKFENIQSQTNSKESELNIPNLHHFGHISQIQSTQTGTSLENTQPQSKQTQSAKPSVTDNIKETGIFQTKFSDPYYDQTPQTISSQSGKIISEQTNQSQLQDTKVGITQTDTNNVQTSTTSSSTSNSQSAVQDNLHTIKPFTDSVIQQSGTSQTNVGIQSISPEFIQSQIEFPAPKQTITQQTASEITQNRFGVTQFGAIVKPSIQSQESLGESYEYKKPDVKLTFDKNTGTSITSSIQAVKPEVSETNFETQNFTATQFGVIPTKPQVSQTQFAFQPAKNNFQQAKFDKTQNKYGLTDFGSQNFKPSSVGQSQQSTGQLYEYKKPEIVITNKDTNTATGQVSESQSKITQISQTPLPTPQPIPIQSVQLQTEPENSQMLNAQNVPTSVFQTSTQFEKPQSVQVNSRRETLKPELNQTPQEGIQTSTSTETIYNQITPQPVKINFEQSTFGITQNKYGLTQFGTQKFKPSTSQSQPYTGQLYEYKKPVETITTNNETVNQFQSQFTEVGQIPSVFPYVSQVKPEQLSITSQTGTTTTQTSNTQKIPAFTSQTSSQFGTNQFGQTNFGTQTFKPPLGQTIQTNTATTGSQFGVVAVKPQVGPTRFVSQSDKVTFGQSTYDSSRNKYGLTQFGTQKFKPSIIPSTQISTELYEYRKPVQTLTPSKENTFTGQVTQTQSQVSQTSSPTPQVVQVNPAQSTTTSQTGAIPTHTLGSQKVSTSTVQTSSQFGKPQCVLNNFGTQTFKPACSQISQSNTATTNTQTGQIQVASQLPKITFGQPALTSVQNKYGLTHFGTQKFKPNQSQQSTEQQYEYKKPAEIVIINKDTATGQITKSQSVQQTEVIPNQTLNIQKESASTSETSITTANTEKMQGSLIGQVSDTQVVSQPVAAIFEQSTLIKDTQNKFGLEESDAEKPKPSISKVQETQGTLYTNKKPFVTLEINKEAQSDLTLNKFNKQEILHTTSGTSQTTSEVNKQYSGDLYVNNNPSIAFVTNAGSSIQEVNKVNEVKNIGGEKISTEKKVIPTQVISEPQTIRIVTNQPIKAESSVYQTKPSQQILQTTSEKAEITRTEEEVGLEIKKPINIQETQSTVEQSQLTNNVNKDISVSVKPEIGNSTLETQVNQTDFGLTESNITLNKPTVSIVTENESSVLNNIKNTQTVESRIQDSKINQVKIISQTQSANTQTNPSALGILSAKPYVNLNQVGMKQDISSLEQISQVTSGAVETTSSQTQSATPALCETSKSEDTNNKQSISHATGTITNQQAISYNTQDGPSNLQQVRPTTEQNSFGSTQTGLPFGYESNEFNFGHQNYHYPHFHHQHDHSYPHDHSYFHGHPYHHDYPHPHHFPYRHDFHHQHHHTGPPGFGFHNHEFESQSGYRHNKPFGYFDNGYTEKKQFEQNRSPFGKFGFFNKPNNFPKTFETTSSNAVTTGSVSQTNNLPSQAQNIVISTQNPTIDKIKGPFGSTFSSNAQTITEPMKPTIITTETKAEDGASISSITGAEPHVPFGKPALHKFGGFFNSNADATVQTAPSLSIAKASTGPSSTRKPDNPSNAIATAQSGNAFGQNNFASAIATTGPVLPQFNTPGGRFQPFSPFYGYPGSAVAKAVSGPQVGLNPNQATTGVPFFSNAFASSTKDSSFASSFVSTTPVTTTIFDSKKGTSNFGSELSTPVFGEVNTAKPIYDAKSATQASNAEISEIFGGPSEPPKFDKITGYQY